MSNIAETRTYTNNGMLASIEDAKDNVTTYQYDGFDRLDKRIYPDTSYEQNSYDANSNVLNLRTRHADNITMAEERITRLQVALRR